ncbi:hypothetical protein D3C78_1187080 [compost metagenome]
MQNIGQDAEFEALVEQIENGIYEQLGYKEQRPVLISGPETGEVVLGTQDRQSETSKRKNTLNVWRSTGRYPDLPYIKVGRMVRYRVRDIAEFLARRRMAHTGQYAQLDASSPYKQTESTSSPPKRPVDVADPLATASPQPLDTLKL